MCVVSFREDYADHDTVTQFSDACLAANQMQPLCIAPLPDSYVTQRNYQMSHVFKLATILLGCINVCTQNFTNAIVTLTLKVLNVIAKQRTLDIFITALQVASQLYREVLAGKASELEFAIRKQAFHCTCLSLLQNGAANCAH